MSTIDEEKLNTLLEQTEFLQVPDHFDQQILKSINALNDQKKAEENTTTPFWAWLALISGSVLSLSQISAYILSVWLTVTAH